MQKVNDTRQAARLLSTNQAAQFLNCGASTIQRLVYGGELPVLRNFKHWRFDVMDLEAFIARKKVLL